MATVGSDRLALLGDLLHALRHRGVAIGPRELDRLRTVFERKPRLQHRELRALLRSVLVKHPRERGLFEPLFDAWCPDCEAEWPQPAPLPSSPNTTPASPARRKGGIHGSDERQAPWWRSRALGVVAGIGGLILAIALLRSPGVVLKVPPDYRPVSGAPVESMPGELPSNPSPQVWYWRATIDPDTVTTRLLASPWRLAWLGLTALGLAVFLLARHHQRFPSLNPKTRDRTGPGWHPLPKPATGPLIPRSERQRALWQIERFVSEEVTQRLDIARTVRDTAQAAGFVHVHYQAAAYERGVQFWWDRQLDAPTARAAAGELAATLQAGGIDFGAGFFIDVPHRIDGTGGRAFRPINEEGAGREAVVAIFLDGIGLAHQLENPLRRRSVERLLRDLSHWPRLCFVDCSANGRAIQDLFRARRLRLQTIRPERLSTWLGGELGDGARAAASGEADRDHWLLAAALALGGTPAHRTNAARLRDQLGLTVGTWRVERIAREINGEPGRIPALINRLLRCEPLPSDGLPRARSVAHRAVSWWRERYRCADQAEARGESRLLPWHGSIPQQGWELEAALLRLYIEPRRATDDLRRIGNADRRAWQSIRSRLRAYCAEDDPRPAGDTEHLIRLTWRFAVLPVETKHTLLALGFQIETARALIPVPPPLALATSALGGLGVVALGAAAWFLFSPARPELLHEAPHADRRLTAQTVRIIEAVPGSSRYRLIAGSARAPVTPVEVGTGAIVPVSWTWAPTDNERGLGRSTLMRAGTLPQPIRGCGDNWPIRSLVAIAAERENPAARRLAIRLLDLGSADQVLVGPDWADHLDEWLGTSAELDRQTQLLVVTGPTGIVDAEADRLQQVSSAWAVVAAADFAAVARKLVDNDDLRGVRSIQEIGQELLPWQRLNGAKEVYLYGGPAQSTDEYGIEWAHICPGTYTRGVLPNERLDLERTDYSKGNEPYFNPPAHTVVASSFLIATTETTEAQYAALVPGAEVDKPRRRPVVNINWQDARQACRAAGGDLPTEAQWEYAARAGSRTAWSFGDDEADLGRYAWYRSNANSRQPVAGRLPNPLGLFDMHGNVWEWTRDAYAKYPGSADTRFVVLDPKGPITAGRRVARGGSFVGPPVFLRSAVRFVVGPEVVFVGLGFRCVRVPPQP